MVQGIATLTRPASGWSLRARGTTTRYVDGNLRRVYAALASQTFEVGSANGYGPVLANVTAAPVWTAAAVSNGWRVQTVELR